MIEAHMNYPVWSSHRHANKRKHTPISHNITLCIWLLLTGLISAWLHHVNLCTPHVLAHKLWPFITLTGLHNIYYTHMYSYSTADLYDMMVYSGKLFMCVNEFMECGWSLRGCRLSLRPLYNACKVAVNNRRVVFTVSTSENMSAV